MTIEALEQNRQKASNTKASSTENIQTTVTKGRKPQKGSYSVLRPI